VADAVRNLAHRCAQAAGDTAALIEESIAKSNDGKTKLDLVSAAVRSITGSADRVQAIIEEVNRGSQEQSLAIQQVVQTIEKMERVTQTTAAHAEEGASAGEELSAHAEALTAMALSLTEMVGSGQARADGLTRDFNRRGGSVPLAPVSVCAAARGFPLLQYLQLG